MDTRKRHKHTEDKTKWVKFTYVGRETRAITKIFKNTNIRVTFGTNNTIGKLLTRNEHNRSKCVNSGIYQLNCPTCNKKYTSQTGKQFRIRFQ